MLRAIINMDDEHPPTPTTTAVPSSSSAAGEGGSSLSLVPHDNPGLGDASGSAAGTNLVTRVWMKRKLQFTSCYEFKKIWGDDNASSSSSGSSCGNITFYRVKPPKGRASPREDHHQREETKKEE